jgi:crossover junction endodeoxyribonuclease RuvC
MRILGLDPGLQRTGWGVIVVEGSHLRGLAAGVVTTEGDACLAVRLASLFRKLQAVVQEWHPDFAAVEETFVNTNPRSALKLGQARGVVLMVPALAGVPVHEYAANTIKKAVVGNGHADKTQVQTMVNILLPGVAVKQADAADALAVAVCHAHHQSSHRMLALVGNR